MTELTKGPSDPELLIDGDIFLYRCGFAVEKMKYLVTFEDGKAEDFCDSAKEAKEVAKDSGIIWSRKEYEPVENALQATHNALKEVWDKFNPDKPSWKGQIYLTGKGNFRDMIECRGGYKDNRDPTHRPKHYRAIKDWLIKKFHAKLINGMEADDAIGIRAYQLPVDKYVVVSNDKDLDQIGGFHYNWVTKDLYYVNEEDAIKFFYTQLISGDPTDNIPGVASKEKAAKLIEAAKSPKECATFARVAYEEKHGDFWAEELDKVARLVWIKRSEDDSPPFNEHYYAE